MQPITISPNRFSILLLLLSALLLFNLGARPIDKIQEVRIAETAREMIAGGDWLVPHYNGELRLQKPPLPYWITAASYRVLGVNAFAARLPAAVFGALSAIALLFFLRRHASPQLALQTAIVFLTSFIGLRYFRSGEADSLLLLCIMLTVFAGYEVFKGGGTLRKVLLFHAAMGLGFLCKGPAAVAIPLLTLLVYALWSRGIAKLKALLSLPGITLFLLLAGGWYAWMFISLPDAAQQFFGRQLDETFISGTHQKPAYWYLAHALEFYFPWSLLLVPAGVWLYRLRPQDELLKLALAWLGVVFVLLTVTANKQMQYALLFAPPIALLVGHYLHQAQDRYARLNLAVLLLVAAGLALLALWQLVKHKPEAWMLAFPLTLIALGVFVIWRLPRWLAPTLLLALLTANAHILLERIDEKAQKRDEVMQLMQIAAPLQQAGATIYQYYDAANAAGDGVISYYAQQAVRPVDEKKLAAIQGPAVLFVDNALTPQGRPMRLLKKCDLLSLWATM